MKKFNKNLVILFLISLMSVFLIVACSDSSSGGSCEAGDTCANINGTWDYTGVVSTGGTETDTLTIIQSEECTFTLISANIGDYGTGTLDGNSICFNATSYDDGGDMISISQTSLELNENVITGISSWSSSDGSSGTTTVTMTKD
jgi:hypothetical protein